MSAPFLHRSHSSILADLFRTLIEPEERLNHFVRTRQNRFSRLPIRPDNRPEQPDLSGNLSTAGGLSQFARSPTPGTSSHVLSTQSSNQSNMSGTVDKPAVGETSSPTASNDLVKAVDKLLNEIGPKFTKVSAEIFAKMDEMAQRLDDMEAAIKAGNDPSTEGN